MFCNEKKQAQIHVLRNFLDDMEQDTSKDSVIEDLERLINSKSCDLREIRESPRINAFDFGKDTARIVKSIATEAFYNAMMDNSKMDMTIEMNLVRCFKNYLGKLIENPRESEAVRICDECGKVMIEGYCLGGGEEYYCSDECLHKNYSHEEFLAMYAGLDNTDPAEVERASKMSQEELDRLSDENDSQSYYTDWEI
jgi:hypothetical protein